MSLKPLIGLAVAGTSILLAGCEESQEAPVSPSGQTVTYTSEDYIEEQAKAAARQQLSAEEKELKEQLVRLQAVDPLVKDMYYGVDANGNKVVHIVREQPIAEQVASASTGVAQSANDVSEQVASSSSMVWPLLGGMALGGLVGHMVTSGGPSNYARHTPPQRVQSYYSREDERKERNSATGFYAGSVINSSRSTIRSQSFSRPSAPSTSSYKSSTAPKAGYTAPASKPSNTVISTRSSSVFKSTSSARSGGYSFGG